MMIYKINSDGTQGDRVTTEYNRYKGKLEPGEYIVKAILGAASTEQKVTVVSDNVAAPCLFSMLVQQSSIPVLHRVPK